MPKKKEETEELAAEALKYHSRSPTGKLQIVPTKPCDTEKDLSLAYSPGVAQPCLEIAKNPNTAYDYTGKSNLVAVISNGTAVLGLGDIGALAAKPVMEGKAVLFKKFANLDVFDIEVNTKNVDEFISTVSQLEPTFGGINLEDIKAPECFEIEKQLKEKLNIPVFHDDQHGTAIISGAALINACQLANHSLGEIKLVVNGAGAASVACTKIFISLGVKKKNIIMCDSKGVIYKGRKEGMNPYKAEFANQTEARTLAEALEGAHCFVGLSVAKAVTPKMLKTMAPSPIVMAMANPTPEILPTEARKVRKDVIIATGRSDFPNQVNNVLGFPYIFRGALDVRATGINEKMKTAAVHAIAKLARQDVPEKVSEAYGGQEFRFGHDYIIPKPFDERILLWVAPAVAKAAMETGVAQKPIKDFDAYREHLEAMQGPVKKFVRSSINKIKSSCKENKHPLPRIVFPEGNSTKIIKALAAIVDENICQPILLGIPEDIHKKIEELELDSLKNLEIIQPSRDPRFEDLSEKFYEMRRRKGVLRSEAAILISRNNYFAAMLVKEGHAEALITGASSNYAQSVRPLLRIFGANKNQIAAGVNFVFHNDRMILFSDTTVNINPTSQEVAKIGQQCAQLCRYLELEPNIAMISYSNFSGQGESPKKMKEACQILKKQFPKLNIDGEMQADAAIDGEIAKKLFPFSKIQDGANVLLFPNLDAANISYKLLEQIGEARVMGPFLMGVTEPANILQRTSSVENAINCIVMTALEAQIVRTMRQQRKHRRYQSNVSRKKDRP